MRLIYGNPKEQGVREEAISALVDRLDREIHSLHGIAVVKNGVVLAEGYWKPYGPDSLHEIHSLAKSLNCLSVGLMAEQGKLHLSDLPARIFKEYLPDGADRRFEDLTVEDLLTMRAGGAAVSTCFAGVESSWITRYFTYPMPSDAGTRFQYDTGASYILSSLVTRAAGKNSLEVLRESVLQPLGIERIRWAKSPEGNSAGGWGMFLSLRDMVRLGILLSRRGRVEETQLYPAGWIAEATQVKTPTGKPPEHPWESGYGYQFWADERTYSAFGGYGQFIMGSKSEDLFVACTGGCPNTETEHLGDLLYRFVATGGAAKDTERYEGPGLKRLLDGLKLPALEGDRLPSSPFHYFGVACRLEQNGRNLEKFMLTDICADCLFMEFTVNGKTFPARAGYGHYISQTANTGDPRWESFAMAYAFEGDTLRLRSYRTETSYYDDYRLTFADNLVTGETAVNLSLTGEKAEKLTVRAVR